MECCIYRKPQKFPLPFGIAFIFALFLLESPLFPAASSSGGAGHKDSSGLSFALNNVAGKVPQDLLQRQPVEERLRRAESAAAFALGNQYERNNDYASALEFYSRAAGQDTYIKIPIRQALVHFRLNEIDKAIALLYAALENHSDSADLHSLIAYGYVQQNNLEKAMVHARLALKSDPTMIHNYGILVEGFTKQGKTAEIKSLFEEASKTDSADAEFYLRLGNLWLRLFNSSRQNLPSAEQFGKVLPLFEKAVHLDPQNARLAFEVGEIASKAGRYEESITYYKKAYAIDPKLDGLREQLAITFITTKREKEAIEILKAILEDNPRKKKIYPLLASLYEKIKQYDKAEQYYLLTLSLGSPTAQDYFMLALVQIQNRKLDQALETLAQAEKGFPGVAAIFKLRATIYLEKKEFDKAEAAFRKTEAVAIVNNPGLLDSDFYLEFASAFEQHGIYERAEALLKRALEIDPDNHDAMNFLGYMWADRGVNLDRALVYLHKALSYENDNPAYLDSLAWIHYKLGEYPDALRYILQAIKGMPDDPIVNEHLGDIYIKVGESEKALAAWRKALPGSAKKNSIEAKIRQIENQLVNAVPAKQ